MASIQILWNSVKSVTLLLYRLPLDHSPHFDCSNLYRYCGIHYPAFLSTLSGSKSFSPFFCNQYVYITYHLFLMHFDKTISKKKVFCVFCGRLLWQFSLLRYFLGCVCYSFIIMKCSYSWLGMFCWI